MADEQWPSENEDFDATTDGVPVQVNDPESIPDQDPADGSEQAPAEEPVSVSEPIPVEVSSADEPANVSPETPQPDVAPAEIPEVKAPKPPKVPKAPGSGSVNRSALELVLVALVIGLGLWAWSLKTDNSNLKDQVVQLNDNPQVAVQRQTQNLISKVGKLLQLPSGETPTIASVTDAAQAKQQSAFFANAENGDKVLMYVKAGEAILYRPSTNKIVLVAPLTFTNSTTPTTPSTTTKK